MGLESAVAILGKYIGLLIEGRRRMIDLLKQRIEQDKLKTTMGEGVHFYLCSGGV